MYLFSTFGTLIQTSRQSMLSFFNVPISFMQRNAFFKIEIHETSNFFPKVKKLK